MVEYSVHYKLRLVFEVDVRQDWVHSEAEALSEVEALGRWMVEHLSRRLHPISAIHPPFAERRRPRRKKAGVQQARR
jgi:hypothetical protein